MSVVQSDPNRRAKPNQDRRGIDRLGQSGNAALAFGLALLPMMLAIGAAVDLTQWNRAYTASRNAVDAGLMAGIRAVHLDGLPADAAMQVAHNAYLQNLGSRIPIGSDTIAFQVDEETSAVVATGSATISTSMLRLVGIQALPLITGEGSKAIRTVGLNAAQSLETTLALATPASLSADSDTWAGLITGARAFADMIAWPERKGRSSRLGIVPFASGVNVGRLITAVSRPAASVATFDTAGRTRTRLMQTTCVAERTGNDAFTDAGPAEAPLQAVFAVNGRCEAQNPVLPLTSDTDALSTALSNLRSGGTVAGHLGIAWAWYLLSPSWGEALAQAEPAAAYADTMPPSPGALAAVRKSAVIVSDGSFDTQFCDSTGRSALSVIADATSAASATPNAPCLSNNGTSAQQAATLCDAMKKAGLSLFTVAYPAKEDTDSATLAACASDSKSFYIARTPGELLMAFKDITMKLTTLFLVQ